MNKPSKTNSLRLLPAERGQLIASMINRQLSWPESFSTHNDTMILIVITTISFDFFRINVVELWFNVKSCHTRVAELGGKNGHENFRQARIYNFCVKCVVFARNHKFAKLTQWNMQYIPCNSALLAQETLFLTQKGTIFAQRSPKCA